MYTSAPKAPTLPILSSTITRGMRPRTRATPEATIIEVERRAFVRHLVGQGEEVLSRIVYREQNWAEIAADLGIHFSTVQARVRRAHGVLEATLRRRLAVEGRRRGGASNG
jgi:DNA-directed RNA polymerase specialized sigma24 family protein